MTDEERKALKIENLPGILMEAVEEMKKNQFILDVLGEHIARHYIEA